MNRSVVAKVRLMVMLLAVACMAGSLESCRGKRGKRKRNTTSWRQRLERALPAGPAPLSPLTDREMSTIVQTARSYTGTPYLTGGTTRVGIDCSGLVVVSYQSVGRDMPRISYQQAEAGTPIREEDLAPGDLIFFTDRRGGSQITHVGLVTEVRGKDTIKFIHTTNSLGVVENNLKQNYWHNLFVKAVRVR